MTRFPLLAALLVCLAGAAQKPISIDASGNFHFATSGMSTTVAGFGVTGGINFPSRSRLQLRTEASMDHFVGSKLLYLDITGKAYDGNPTMVSLKVGPEFYFSKLLSLSALYGYVHYNWFDMTVDEDVFKTSLAVHCGKSNRLRTALSFTTVLKQFPHRFWSVSIGYRIL